MKFARTYAEDNFADGFRSFLGEMDRIDVATSPNTITIKALFEKLMHIGFGEIEATDILSSIDIEVSQKFLDEGLLEETVETFVNVICKMKKEYNKISPYLFAKIFRKKGITLKYPA